MPLQKTIVVLCLLAAAAAHAQEISNADFSQWSADKPADWVARSNKQQLNQATDTGHESVGTALQVELIKDGGNSYGQILQKLKLDPYTRYRISGDIRSSVGGLGIYQVKVVSNKKELERLSSERSTTEWTTMSIEFDSAGADEVQILCRYNQKGQNVGESIWWTNLRIEKLGEGAPPRGPESLEVAPAGTDQYVTPGGAGNHSGSDWDNARPAMGLEDAVSGAGPGNTVYLGSGTYPKTSLRLTGGGSGPDAMLTIKGVDTGGGLPRFVSDFDKAKPAKSGGIFMAMDSYVGFVSIEDIQLERFMVGLVMYGPHRGVRITNLDLTYGREGVIINGGAIAGQLDSGTHDIVVQDCDFTYYTKRGIRIRGGVHGTRIINCHADSGGKEWAVEAFPMGFSVEGSKAEGIKDHDITYEQCTASNNWHINGEKYWNADGFCAERNTSDITYIDCGAFGNTDGGWDLKTENPTLINCIALGNKRNFRFWSRTDTPATLTNCLSAYSHKYGGSGNRNGLHIAPGAGVIVNRSTFVDTGDAIDIDSNGKATTWAKLTQCIIDEPTGHSQSIDDNKLGQITLDNCIATDTASPAEPGAALFAAASPEWRGGDDAFNSSQHPDHGYHYDGQGSTP